MTMVQEMAHSNAKTGVGSSVVYRRARHADVLAIASLINGFAAERVMLPKTPESIALGVDDFVVATDRHGHLLGCAALKEYSPSLAEVASVAVAREAHGLGVGSELVRMVERLAARRGIGNLIALTLTPKFFQSLNYGVTDRALFPEKIRRDCQNCPRRAACDEICVYRSIAADASQSIAA